MSKTTSKHTFVRAMKELTPNPRYQNLPIIDKSEGFKLIKQFYDQTHFVDHQIDSYNDFISRGMQTIVRREQPIEINGIKVEFNHIYVDKPKFIIKTRVLHWPFYCFL